MSGTGAKEDLRVSKTRYALQTALFALLEKMSFAKITVNDICKTAMVSRATFYMHYEDKYALLRYALTQMREQMAPEAPDPKETIRRMVNLAYEKSRVFKNLLLLESNQELSRMFSEAMVTEVTARLEERQQAGCQYPMPPQILALFISGGISYLLIWWMAEGYPIPPDEMAAHLITLAEKWDQMEGSTAI